MRPIHLAQLDKTRPALVLTRLDAIESLTSVTVAPISTRRRNIASEVAVGLVNGLDQESVVSCDNLHTIRVARLGRRVGALLPEQETDLADAISAAFDLLL